MKSISQLRMMAFASLLAALMTAGAYISVPVGPVPIVLQNMFVFLAGLLLGCRWGLASVGVYLLAGACGLPVFAGGMGGIGRIIGPTGGYLIGYLPGVIIVGYISQKGAARISFDIIAMICGTIVLYACGVVWLKTLTDMTWTKTLAAGMLPFLIGDGLKIVAAAAIARAIRPILQIESNGFTKFKPGKARNFTE
jgi:biotin transport system substrate-specific component